MRSNPDLTDAPPPPPTFLSDCCCVLSFFSNKQNYGPVLPLPLPKSPFNLNDVYALIRPLSPPEPISTVTTSSLTNLHATIPLTLREHLYPFLSPHNILKLRQTCKTVFHHVAIPPLKLNLFKHQITSLKWMNKREIGGGTEVDGPKVRGGILADDPGLGKTVTVMAIVTQNLGAKTDTASENIVDSERIFSAYYREYYNPVTRLLELREVMNDIIKFVDRKFDYDFFKSRSHVFDLPEYSLLVSGEHIWLNKILQDVEADKYSKNAADFHRLQADVRRVFQNGIVFNASSPEIQSLCQICLDHAHQVFETFIIQAKKSARRWRHSWDSPTGALVDANRDLERASNLKQSHTTLVVVPHQLLKHWDEQVLRHIDFEWISRVGGHDGCEIRRLSGSKSIIEYKNRVSPRPDSNEAKNNLELGIFPKASRKFMLVDYNKSQASHPLPSPSEISQYDIVVTSVERLSLEWKRGKENSKAYRYEYEGHRGPSPLLKVNFFRIVVDEGHSMGRSGITNSIQFSSWIYARRRWIMSGTPTPASGSNLRADQASANECKSILGLLKYLKHPRFLEENGGKKMFEDNFLKGWKRCEPGAFFRVCDLLQQVMVRHDKRNIAGIPKPIFKNTKVNMADVEVLAYNTITSAARLNIILTTMEGGKTSGWQDSLLNPSQYKFALEMMQNIRLACCGGSRVAPTLSDKFFSETLHYLDFKHGAQPAQLQMARNFMNRAVMMETTSCSVCAQSFQILALTPCVHFVCSDCVELHPKKCGACGETYDVDDFQLLQPGFDTQWQWNLEGEKRERKAKIQMSEALRQSIGGTPNGGATPLAPPLNLNAAATPNPVANPNPNRKHKCVYSKTLTEGTCTICMKEHWNGCTMTATQRCHICNRESVEVPREESKATYIANTLMELKKAHACPAGVPENLGPQPLKVLIFSQFRQVSDTIGDRLLRKFGQVALAEYFGKHKNDELIRFKNDPECVALLAGKDASHGLDLSFITHIFLLDEIWDAALKEQVIARAYRMGTRRSVVVEQLIAKDSIEESMNELNLKTRWEEDDDKEAVADEDCEEADEVDEGDDDQVIDDDENAKKIAKEKEAVTQKQNQRKLIVLLKRLKVIKKKNEAKRKLQAVAEEVEEEGGEREKEPKRRVGFA
ncbi:hypothetical protein TrST_g9992 [Triparma strigata]|uniref:F-box protein n=1 Tax=Triparma strigata TaxID=1606541 RepID=A0A9W7ERH8_9STRA|nr:hypothetical protein TrST_g9992 [Triparma strigata]